MMPSVRSDLQAGFSRLLGTPHRFYIAATGAGAGLQELLWAIPGISSILVGAEFPYAPEATDRFLGFRPESYCSERTAIALAMEAYTRAFLPWGAPAVGLGLTASVASTKAHRGDHRVFLATVSDTGVWVYSLTLPKGTGWEYRQRDGDICDTLGAVALLDAVHQEHPRRLGLGLPDYEQVKRDELAMEVLLTHPLFAVSGKRPEPPANGNGLTLFPGAFNPPHEGHVWMAKEHGATFHVTINPPHKPALTVAEVLQRAKLLEGFPRIFTVGDPLYIDKARRFPGAKILIGVDALERMLDPKWGVEIAPLLSELRQLGIRFLVADREINGTIQTLDHITGAPMDLCERVLRPAQHLAMSSTKLRAATP
jgi:hypothetical protein